MPTYWRADRFLKDWENLDETDKAKFKSAVKDFIADLEAGGQFRSSLRVKRVQGTKNVYEMSWAPDGRATWQYGEEIYEGVPHIQWRRVGTHDIFRTP